MAQKAKYRTPLQVMKWLIVLILLALLGFWIAQKRCEKAPEPEPVAAEEDPDLQYGTDLLQPGTDAPDFTLCDSQDKPFTLSELRGKDVVLVFWASWCPDCRAEVPLLKEMYAAADPEKTAFVSVSFDREKEKWLTYIEENQLPGIQVFDPAGKKESTIGADFHIKWIPSLYLIGPDGKIKLATVVAEKIQKAL